MKAEFPKVLIISHTSFTNANSMGSTLASYFSAYPQDKLSQLYIKEMIPDIPICFSYYKITDLELLNKIKHPFKTTVGSKINLSEEKMKTNKGTNAKSESIGGYKHRALALLLRNILWGTRLWNTKQFKAWIKEIAPQVILVQPGDFAYILKFATKLSKKLDIPLVVHQSEAYYLKENQSKSLIYSIYRNNYKKTYEKMMARASECVYLCETLERDYKKFFPNIGCTIMKSTALELKEDSYVFNKNEPKFIYAGNLGEAVGRCEPLADIGRAVKKLGYKIDVYTSSSGEHMKELTPENGIVLHPAVSYDVLQEKIAESDFIVHIENQSQWHKQDLKYAFSTKIADMLASGRCGIIYGSSEISGIEYFKEHALGCVIEDKEELFDKIKQLIDSDTLRENYIKAATERANEYHNADINAQRMNRVILKAFGKGEE